MPLASNSAKTHHNLSPARPIFSSAHLGLARISAAGPFF